MTTRSGSARYEGFGKDGKGSWLPLLQAVLPVPDPAAISAAPLTECCLRITQLLTCLTPCRM